ncbi:MAG: C40 family peptidase [Ilumatobacteraceae bacterium]|jgi:peptidoglycan DL-endopeptidase CwlO|nr:C40 family peptidase [Ilumatobacteraceae bacterium]
MKRVGTFLRGVAVTGLLSAFLYVGPASAVSNSGKEPSSRFMQMPGERIRQRPQIAIDAIQALSLIMRTENREDPTYLDSRRVVSDGVAKRLSLDPTDLNRAWSRAPRDHQIAVLSALTQLDVPYLEGKEDSYVKMDCSGLLWFAWRTAGVDMPRQAVSQLDRRMRVDREDAVAGDITGEGTHVQIYLGTGLAMIHAPFGGKLVKFKIMSAEQAARVVWTNPSNIATFRL